MWICHIWWPYLLYLRKIFFVNVFHIFALEFSTFNSCLHSWAIHRSMSKKLLFDRKLFGISSAQHIPMKSDSHVGILSHISLQIQIRKRTHAVHSSHMCYSLSIQRFRFMLQTSTNIHWDKCLVDSEKKFIHLSTISQVFVCVVGEFFLFHWKKGKYDDEC